MARPGTVGPARLLATRDATTGVPRSHHPIQMKSNRLCDTRTPSSPESISPLGSVGRERGRLPARSDAARLLLCPGETRVGIVLGVIQAGNADHDSARPDGQRDLAGAARTAADRLRRRARLNNYGDQTGQGLTRSRRAQDRCDRNRSRGAPAGDQRRDRAPQLTAFRRAARSHHSRRHYTTALRRRQAVATNSSSPASDRRQPRSRSQIQISTEVVDPWRIGVLGCQLRLADSVAGFAPGAAGLRARLARAMSVPVPDTAR